LLYLYLYVY